MKEVWKTIKDYPNYEVSNKGQIRFFEMKIKKWIILERVRQPTGYKVIRLFSGIQRKRSCLHTLILEAFISPRPEGFVGNHKDGNKVNDDIRNLEWIDKSADINHAYQTGLHNAPDMRGEKHPGVKLKEGDVKKIRRLRINGMKLAQIAELFNVTKGNIHLITSRQRWKHI